MHIGHYLQLNRRVKPCLLTTAQISQTPKTIREVNNFMPMVMVAMIPSGVIPTMIILTVATATILFMDGREMISYGEGMATIIYLEKLAMTNYMDNREMTTCQGDQGMII